MATTLSMVANAGANTTPEDFKAVTNSQAPHTWSQALSPTGCSSPIATRREKVIYFIDERWPTACFSLLLF